MKQAVILLTALFFSTLAFGQVEFKPTIGVNISNVSKDPESGEAKGRTGWQFGASFLIGNKFFFEPGVFYLQKSAEFTSSTVDELNFTSQLKGFRVPVAVGYHLLGSEETTAALRILGGGSVFFLTGADSGDLTKDDFTSPSWGVFAGAGLDIWILFIDVKYEWSLSNVSSLTDFDIGKQHALFANAGVRIKF